MIEAGVFYSCQSIRQALSCTITESCHCSRPKSIGFIVLIHTINGRFFVGQRVASSALLDFIEAIRPYRKTNRLFSIFIALNFEQRH